MLGTRGVLVMMGLITEKSEIKVMSMIFNSKSIRGSCIGGVGDTIELIKLCAEKKI